MTLDLKIAVCDDNETDRKKILSYISEYLDANEITAKTDLFSSGEEFLASDINSYGLVFMDIFMGDSNGMEIAKKLIAENSKIKIVFNSTSSEFAAESYDVSALYYLVKPLLKEKVFYVLDRFFSIYTSLKTITVKVGRIEEEIYINDIVYIEAANHKSIIHTKHGEIEASINISKIADMLLPYDFIKPVRYALVALREIMNIPSDEVILSDGKHIPVSRGERANVKKAFIDYKWKITFGTTRG